MAILGLHSVHLIGTTVASVTLDFQVQQPWVSWVSRTGRSQGTRRGFLLLASRDQLCSFRHVALALEFLVPSKSFGFHQPASPALLGAGTCLSQFPHLGHSDLPMWPCHTRTCGCQVWGCRSGHTLTLLSSHVPMVSEGPDISLTLQPQDPYECLLESPTPPGGGQA